MSDNWNFRVKLIGHCGEVEVEQRLTQNALNAPEVRDDLLTKALAAYKLLGETK